MRRASHTGVGGADGTSAPDTSRRSSLIKPETVRTPETVNDYLDNHRTARKPDLMAQSSLKTQLQASNFCSAFDESVVDIIISSMVCFEFQDKESVVIQGELGTHFFVIDSGTFNVVTDGRIGQSLTRGKTFGDVAVFFDRPSSETIVANGAGSAWGVHGDAFKTLLRDHVEQHHNDNYAVVESIKLFDELPWMQKTHIGSVIIEKQVEVGENVITQGEVATAIYSVKSGSLSRSSSAMCDDGFHSTNSTSTCLGAGDSFGEPGVLSDDNLYKSTVVATTRCHLYCIPCATLTSVLGAELRSYIQQHIALLGLRRSAEFSNFSLAQQTAVIKVMDVKEYKPREQIKPHIEFAVVLDGDVVSGNAGGSRVVISQGYPCGDESFLTALEARTQTPRSPNSPRIPRSPRKGEITDLAAGARGAKLGVITALVLKKVFALSEGTNKLFLLRKVPIFMHLSMQQLDRLAKALVTKHYHKGDCLIKQGEPGTQFFVVVNGEVEVIKDGERIRTLGEYTHFGERSLLKDGEPRTATIKVSSESSVLWTLEKPDFEQLMEERMRDQLKSRIEFQEVQAMLPELNPLGILGNGAFGVVRLVEDTTTGLTYALKRVKKLKNGRIPKMVVNECDIMKCLDHPFLVRLVKTYETSRSIYMLMEHLYIDLHTAIRKVPGALSTAQAQFFIGSIALSLEVLSDTHIMYRDLKPENVMLDSKGYVKLIDFGTAKKLGQRDGDLRAYTVVGTPHYVAPEVVRMKGYGPEVDLWSLGVVLYEFVCINLPFGNTKDNPQQVLNCVLHDKLRFPETYKDKVGKNLMTGLMNRQPERRLGAGLGGFHDLRQHEFFSQGHESAHAFFDNLIGRQLDPPVLPKFQIKPMPANHRGSFDEDDNSVANDDDSREFCSCGGPRAARLLTQDDSKRPACCAGPNGAVCAIC